MSRIRVGSIGGLRICYRNEDAPRELYHCARAPSSGRLAALALEVRLLRRRSDGSAV